MEFLKTEQHGAVTLLTINRPNALNALNKKALLEMKEFLQKAELDTSCKAIIITGAGEKAFIAGADIKEMATLNNHEILQFSALGQEVTLLLERSPFLTIAAVNGLALGGGFEMALACDYIYAAEEAKLGLPEVQLGLIPGFGGTQRLTSVIGGRLAKELIMTGGSLTAKEAQHLGIINKVCSKETLIQQCIENAKQVTSLSHTAVSHAKRAINCCHDKELERGLELERKLFVECFDSEGRKQGFEKFLSKLGKKKDE